MIKTFEKVRVDSLKLNEMLYTGNEYYIFCFAVVDVVKRAFNC